MATRNKLIARIVGVAVNCRVVRCNRVIAVRTRSTLVKRLGPRVHMSSALRDLHWLPVNFRIMYKRCLMLHAAHTHRCPEYISRLVTSTVSIPSRPRLRSATGNRYEAPKTRLQFGERAFSVAGPTTWNNLPKEITDICEIGTLKSKHKTHLFTMTFTNI